MKRIGWYIAREFVLYFFACFISLVFVAVAFVALAELDKLEKGGWNEFFRATFAGVPLLIEIVAPISVLLATTISYILLSRTSEIVAMMSAGISYVQLLQPLAICCILIASFCYFNQSYLILRWGSGKLASIVSSATSDSVWKFYRGKLFHFGKVSKPHQTAEFGRIFSFQENSGLKRIDEFANIERRGGHWSYESGRTTWIAPKQLTISSYEARFLEEEAFPEIFEKELTNPKYAGFAEIVTQIEIKRAGALSYREELFAVYQKIAGLIAIFTMAVLALPFSLFSGRSSNVRIGITFSIALGFVFWLVDQVFLSLHTIELLPAEIAAFGANMLFLSFAALMLHLRR